MVFSIVWVIPCFARTITVDNDGPADFNNIQAAIDDSNDGDIIIVAEGTYFENINFNGRNITLTSTNPQNPNTVASTIINGRNLGSVVTFDGTESSECVLAGFTITEGREDNGGGIYGNRTMATIESNVITGNIATGGPNWDGTGGGIFACDGLIHNNIIVNNQAFYKGGGILAYDGVIQNNLIYGNCAKVTGGGGIYCTCNYPSCNSCPIISNCTIVGNTTGWDCTGSYSRGGGIYCSTGIYHVVTNCIIRGNIADDGPEIALNEYSINPVEPVVRLTISHSDVQGGQSMVYVHGYCDLNWGEGNVDVDPCFAEPGYWDPNGTPEEPNDDFWGEGDYHLKSQAGRWDPNSQSWVQDDVTSPCIDAGDPMLLIGHEPFPNGGIVNMGAYGGTAEASKSYFDEPVCETIVAGDINGDCKIDFADFQLMALHWLEDNAVVNSNSIVNDGIKYYIRTDKHAYHLGEEVQMLYRVTNLKSEDVKFVFSQSPEWNFWVKKYGENIWKAVNGWWLMGTSFTLTPGEHKEYSHAWDMRDSEGQLINAGFYMVTGGFDAGADEFDPEFYGYSKVSVSIEITP